MISRLINKVNPRSPKSVIYSAREWVNDRGKKVHSLRAPQPTVWVKDIEPPRERIIDYSKISAVTEEDYLLRADISKNACIRTRGRELYSIERARIMGPEGVIISPDNKLFCEFSYTNADCKHHSIFRRRRISKLRKLKGNYTTLVYPDSLNYYHWLIESVPNIETLGKYLGIIDGIFIPEKAKNYHIETLSALGVSIDKIRELGRNDYFECERLYIPSFSSGWAVHQWIPAWYRNSIICEKSNKKERKLYLSRKDSGWRRVKNEDEVMRFLLPYGYEHIELTKLSFKQQAELFYEAHSIVSAHGAGLANLVFCRPGTSVLEIFPPRWTSLCYMHLSAVANCRYHYMIAQPLGQSKEEILRQRSHVPTDGRAQSADLAIPLDKLRYYVDGQESQ